MAAIEAVNNAKAKLVYDVIDGSSFYKGVVQPEHRSKMNITFHLPDQALLDQFLKGALREGLYALKGYRDVGGVRASMYNAMPLEGAQTLASYMKEFERTNG